MKGGRHGACPYEAIAKFTICRLSDTKGALYGHPACCEPPTPIPLPYTTATLTQLIGGSESNRQVQSSPLSRPIHSWPVVVPK